MKILITGGAGYVGIKLTARLLEKGHDVTVLDNFMYGLEPFLFLAQRQGLEVRKQDIRNGVGDLAPFDVVFHLAAISGLPACSANPHSAQMINVDGTARLLDALGPGQTVIYASTTSFYGKAGKVFDETTPVEPVSWYGITKYEAEQRVMERENAISLRFATIFGFSPRMRNDLMVNDFVYRALKDGLIILFNSHSKRTFIHIDDAVDGYLFALENAAAMRGRIFNVGGEGLNHSKMEIARIVEHHVPCKILDTGDTDKDLRNFIVSFDRIADLGFVPARTVDEGVRELSKIFTFYDYYTHYRTI